MQLLLIALTSCSDHSSAPPPAQTTDPDLLSLWFDEPRSFDELAQFAVTNGLVVEEVRSESDDFTAGYTVSGRRLYDIREDFLAQQRTLFQFLAGRGAPDSVRLLGIGPQTGTSAARLDDLPLTTMTVRTPHDPLVLENLRPFIRESAPMLPGHEAADPSPPAAARRIPTSPLHESWAPSRGYVDVTRNYAYNEFTFSNTSGFNSASCYEHETNIWKTSFANYNFFWASNLPVAYYDVDPTWGFDTFAIGTLKANSLRANHRYWTFVSLYPQRFGAREARVTIDGQLGERRPSWCYSFACVYILETTLPNLTALDAPGQLFYSTRPTGEGCFPAEAKHKTGYLRLSKPPAGFTAGLVWFNAAQKEAGNRAESTIAIDYLAFFADVNGRTVELDRDEFGDGISDVWLYRRDPWFGADEHSKAPVEFVTSGSGTLVLRPSRFPNNVWHGWNSYHPASDVWRVTIPPGATRCWGEARVRISGPASFQLGIDYWRSPTALYAGPEVNNQEAGASDWRCDDSSDWRTLLVGK